ncbi:MAG TPA: NUDIX domain-containing protein [Candidatus Saccharimonadales bacterium]
MTTKLCDGRWDEISSWEFYLSDEMPPRDVCVAASCVGILNGKIVLSRTHRGWDCLGGHIEDGESVEETMQREALEEGGLRVERFRLLGFRKVTNSKVIIAKQTGKPYPLISFMPWFVAVSSLPLVPTTGDEGEIFESRAFDVEEACTLSKEEQPIIKAAVAFYEKYMREP